MATPEGTLVLGVDLSTQSCTVEVRHVATFDVAGSASVPLPPVTPPVSEQDPADWWSALVRCMEALRASGIDTNAIAAVSVAGQCHGLVPLDAAGEVIRPAKLWNDTTSAPQMERLVERFGNAFWADRVGSVPSAAMTVAKLAWLIENEPETIARLAMVVLPHDFINLRLTGEPSTDRSEASGTGYFDAVRDSYDVELLTRCFDDVLPWECLFPEVRGPSELAGHVTAEAAGSLGLTAGIPVAIGGGDQHVGALGLGMRDGDVVFSLGTSGVVITHTSHPVHDASGCVDGVSNASGGWLPLVCTLNCTKTTDWAADLLGIDVLGLDALAMSVPVDAHRPRFAAYLDGERSPRLPVATGVISGLQRSCGRAEFALSAVEGVVMGLMRGLDGLKALGVPTDGRIIAVGGGAKSSAYRQVIADLAGMPVLTVDTTEATVRGACIQALNALLRGDVADSSRQLAPTPTSSTAPRPGAQSWQDLKGSYMDTADFAATTIRS